jgi:uncharacterized membrane protein YGL010W
MNARTHRWFEEYAAAHRHPMNRLTHKVAIPVIVFHILAMLDWFTLVDDGSHGRISVGHVGWGVASLFWILHLPRSGLLLAGVTAPMIVLAPYTPRWSVVALAVFGWVVQLAGHRVWEKNQPAFLRNLLQALIGPLFFVAVLVGEWPRANADGPGSASR